MILLGCLLAFSIAVAPRVILVFAWIFSERWQLVWQGQSLVPLLGIIFLPYTTIMYLLVWTLNGGIEGIDWLWIGLGVLLDIWKWSQVIANRQVAKTQTMRYYPAGAPGYGGSSASTGAAISSGQVPPIGSPTALDHDTAPMPGATPPSPVSQHEADDHEDSSA